MFIRIDNSNDGEQYVNSIKLHTVAVFRKDRRIVLNRFVGGYSSHDTASGDNYLPALKALGIPDGEPQKPLAIIYSDGITTDSITRGSARIVEDADGEWVIRIGDTNENDLAWRRTREDAITLAKAINECPDDSITISFNPEPEAPKPQNPPITINYNDGLMPDSITRGSAQVVFRSVGSWIVEDGNEIKLAWRRTREDAIALAKTINECPDDSIKIWFHPKPEAPKAVVCSDGTIADKFDRSPAASD